MTDGEHREVTRRGDSFDIGETGQASISEGGQGVGLASLMQNPESFIGALSLTSEQAKNVRSIVVGSGAGIGHRLLADIVGDELAGAAGGFVAGYLIKKYMRGK